MFCPKCGKINPDNEEKCSGCGAQLHEEAETQVCEKKGRGMKIAFAIIVVLVIICVAVLLLNGCSSGTLPDERITF